MAGWAAGHRQLRRRCRIRAACRQLWCCRPV